MWWAILREHANALKYPFLPYIKKGVICSGINGDSEPKIESCDAALLMTDRPTKPGVKETWEAGIEEALLYE